MLTRARYLTLGGPHPVRMASASKSPTSVGFSWLLSTCVNRTETGQTLHFHAIDCGGEWAITARRKGFTLIRERDTAAVIVERTAGDLLLLSTVGPPG